MIALNGALESKHFKPLNPDRKIRPELLVKLQIYEGPLDLLLHLIKKNEVDLDDIPVALITAQYLDYLDLMEALNVELAADFLVMAATLTQIKSRLLLPREGGDDLENDPADELKSAIIDPLLERLGLGDYRGAAEALGRRRLLGSDVFVRGGRPLEEAGAGGPDELAPASLFDLVEAFRRLAEKKAEKKTINFVVENKTIAQRIVEIQTCLKERQSGLFEDLCAAGRSQAELTLTFLALLELARTGFLRLYQNLSRGPELRIYLFNPDAELSDLSDLAY
ncbi:MAG: segregation/condensation protein A [Candidatus Adiutrix sp.]|jgi:segregation and condensation protein A|nr:segregation/condensation protein A [Candidatus Adiutrix sp.]